MPRESEEKMITVNRKARHDYFIDETVEAGIMLLGAEVKSLRDGKVNLKDSYAKITKGARRTWSACTSRRTATRRATCPTRNGSASCCCTGARSTGSPARRASAASPWCRPRCTSRTGSPRSRLGLARGKEHHDKRDSIREAESKREVDRVMKARNRSRA